MTSDIGTATEQEVPKCIKCRENPGKYKMRNELQCTECFDKYIRSKCVKRMESYKIRAAGTDIPTFILPISFGVSSTSLLFLLDSQLRHQRKKVTRTRYKLMILHIDESILGDPPSPPLDHLDEVKKRFPEAGEYMCAKLEDIYNFQDTVELLGEVKGEKKDACLSNQEAFQKLILALPSPTSRMDLASVVRTRLMVAIAHRENCKGILWGCTTTKLAERTLAETAKGRGFSLPWQIADGPTPYGLSFFYPMRDLFKKEIVTFTSEILDPPLMPLCIAHNSQPKHTAAAATSGRNITVDELMTQYFESMEDQYSSIVSNVTRTLCRLTVSDPEAITCRICGLPGDGGESGLTLGPNEERGPGSSDGMCYGCMRATYGAQEYSWPI